MSKAKLQEILTRRLKLKDAKFILERFGTRLNGSVISPTFKGKGDLERQRMIRKALDAEFGDESTRTVGMVLAYTPEEWDFDSVPNGAESIT